MLAAQGHYLNAVLSTCDSVYILDSRIFPIFSHILSQYSISVFVIFSKFAHIYLLSSYIQEFYFFALHLRYGEFKNITHQNLLIIVGAFKIFRASHVIKNDGCHTVIVQESEYSESWNFVIIRRKITPNFHNSRLSGIWREMLSNF